MSQQLISHSPDLKRLRDEGYHVTIQANHVVVADVPYVNEQGEVCRGALISTLSLAGDVAARPSDHVVSFRGDYPCDAAGKRLTGLVNSAGHRNLGGGLEAHFTFSRKPTGGYLDYFHKMTTYAALLAGPAEMIDPSATAKTFAVVDSDEDDSPFVYLDTATSRAGIGAMADRLTGHKVSFAGVGGTGAYALDLVAKTPVAEIHIWDGDTFDQHNAFRAPGAARVTDLAERPNKAEYFAKVYSAMHRGITAHPEYLDTANVAQLADSDFVFICMGDGPERKLIVDTLVHAEVPFIDVGIGVYEVDGRLAGSVRVTTSTPDATDHLDQRLPHSDADPAGDYATNVQIADLNALNAALAVVRWKKQMGFYNDLEAEHHSVYDIDGNQIVNDERRTP